MGGAYHCIISEFSCGFPLDPILTLTAKAVGQQNRSGKWPKKDMDQSPKAANRSRPVESPSGNTNLFHSNSSRNAPEMLELCVVDTDQSRNEAGILLTWGPMLSKNLMSAIWSDFLWEMRNTDTCLSLPVRPRARWRLQFVQQMPRIVKTMWSTCDGKR